MKNRNRSPWAGSGNYIFRQPKHLPDQRPYELIKKDFLLREILFLFAKSAGIAPLIGNTWAGITKLFIFGTNYVICRPNALS
jgi:hypothetical protein